MLTRNWSKKTLFRQLFAMEENPSELVASNQQNQNRNSGQYVNSKMCQRAFKINRGLLQQDVLSIKNCQDVLSIKMENEILESIKHIKSISKKK